MKESQREDLTLYKDYADKQLYEKVMALGAPQMYSAARSIFVEISMKYDLPDEMTPAYMKRLDASLNKSGTSLSAIVNKELARVIKEEEEFEAIKDSEAFQKEYADYAANYKTAVID